MSAVLLEVEKLVHENEALNTSDKVVGGGDDNHNIHALTDFMHICGRPHNITGSRTSYLTTSEERSFRLSRGPQHTDVFETQFCGRSVNTELLQLQAAGSDNRGFVAIFYACQEDSALISPAMSE